MSKNLIVHIQTVIGKFVSAFSGLAFFMGVLVVIPLSLWFAWAHRSTVAYSVAQTLFCLSFAWGLMSMLLAQRGLRKLSSSERMRVFSGPRPEDSDELYAWKWLWQFMYAVIAVMLSMIAIPTTAWLSGK
jgi:hypothetical protein